MQVKLFLLLFLLCVPTFAGEWDLLSHYTSVNLEGNDLVHFRAPIEIDCDNEGNIYLVDVLGIHVSKLSPDSKLTFAIGRRGQGPGEFVMPYDIAIDRKRGRMWVADQIGRKMLCFDLDGELLLQETMPDHQPFSIVVREDGNLIVGGTGATNLALYDENLKRIKRFGRSMLDPMADGAKLKHMISRFMSLTLSPDGKLFVAYVFDPVLECYDPDGKLLWESERPWIRKDRKPVPAVHKGMTFNNDAEKYHLNILFKDNRLYVVSGNQKAILVIDPVTGKYIDHKKMSHGIRGIAGYKDVLYAVSSRNNTIHIYSSNKKSLPKNVTVEKAKGFFHKKKYSGKIADAVTSQSSNRKDNRHSSQSSQCTCGCSEKKGKCEAGCCK